MPLPFLNISILTTQEKASLIANSHHLNKVFFYLLICHQRFEYGRCVTGWNTMKPYPCTLYINRDIRCFSHRTYRRVSTLGGLQLLQSQPKLCRHVGAMILRITAKGGGGGGGGGRAFTAMLIYAFMSCAYKHAQWAFQLHPRVCLSLCVCACIQRFSSDWLSYSEAKAELVLPVNTHHCGICCTDS